MVRRSLILKMFGDFVSKSGCQAEVLTHETMRISARVRTFMALSILVLTMTVASRADDVVTHWNRVMLAAISAGGTDPITSTRTAAMVQAAVFDCVNGIERKYTPIHADFGSAGPQSDLRRQDVFPHRLGKSARRLACIPQLLECRPRS